MQAILTTLKRLTNLSRHLRPTRRPATPSACLRLEALEDRLVPSVTPLMARGPSPIGPGGNPIVLLTPAPPTGFAVYEESSIAVHLSWNASSGTSGYFVQKEVGNSWQQIANLSSSTTTVVFGGLATGNWYNFRVGAYNSFGTGWTSSQSVVTYARRIQGRVRYHLNSNGQTIGHLPNCWSGWRTSWLGSTCERYDRDSASMSWQRMGGRGTGKAPTATWCSRSGYRANPPPCR